MQIKNILILLGSIDEFRKPNVIKNVLIGKKTVSTLYWGMQYDLNFLFGVMHNYKFDEINSSLLKLSDQKMILINDLNEYRLTSKGNILKNQLVKLMPEANQKISTNHIDQFKDRFNLASQVASEFSYENNHYYAQKIAFVDEYRVKQWYLKHKHNLVEPMFQSINDFLKPMDENLADIFINNLVGHDFLGKSLIQISYEKQISIDILELIINIMYMNFFNYIIDNKIIFFKELIDDLYVKNLVTKSATETFQIYQNLKDLKLVSKRRSIKISTVKEHLLEISILDPQIFPFKDFLNDDLINKLNNIFKTNPTITFNEIKTILTVDFFIFRLYQVFRRQTIEK